MNTTLNQVEWCLKEYPLTRSSDMELIYTFLRKYYGATDTTTLHDILKRINNKGIPSFESITRARRKVQEAGKYPAKKQITEERKRLEGQFIKQMTL